MKRIIVACDGTWVNSDNGWVRDSYIFPWKTGGRLAIASNVTRIVRAIPAVGSDGVQQITYYQAGLGSQDNWYSWLIGGYLGEGISENIREAYAYIANNYVDGDEIYILGFSRGAFTARSISGMIDQIGLLTKTKGMSDFYSTFKDWENQNKPNWINKYPSRFFELGKRPVFDPVNYQLTLQKMGLTRANIPVKAVAVWDTVGTLGVPQFKWSMSKTVEEYSFINTEVPRNLQFAYQALALDEERTPFSPTIWEHPKDGTPTSLKELKQCWFPGVHSNIGGGYPDTEMADLTLAWIINQLSDKITFDDEFVEEQQKLNYDYYATEKELDFRGYGLGQVYSSAGFTDKLFGASPRTPGEYYAIDPKTGKTLHQLVNTKEFIHPCVRARIAQGGKGTRDKGDYAPKSLAKFEVYKPGRSYAGGNPWPKEFDSRWKYVGGKRADGSVLYIVEDAFKAGTVEAEMLDAWPAVKPHPPPKEIVPVLP